MKSDELVFVVDIPAVLRALLSDSKHETSPATHSDGEDGWESLNVLEEAVKSDGRQTEEAKGLSSRKVNLCVGAGRAPQSYLGPFPVFFFFFFYR